MKINKNIIKRWDVIRHPGSKKYKNFACVYAIVNKVNSKAYIGGTTNLFKRIPKHKYRLNLNKHENTYLQNSYNKHGEESFEWYVVEKCTQDNALVREQKYLDTFKTYKREMGYNIQKEATNRRHTLETIEKLRQKRKLQKPTMLGKKHSKEAKEKMRQSHIGQVPWNKGKPCSEETKLRLRTLRKGVPVPQEMRDRISATMKGRPAHNKGTKDSEETKLKKSISQKKRWANLKSDNK